MSELSGVPSAGVSRVGSGWRWLTAIGLIVLSVVLWYVWAAVAGLGLSIATSLILMRLGQPFPPFGFAVAFLLATAVVQACLPLLLLRWRRLAGWATVTGLVMAVLIVGTWSVTVLGGHAHPGSRSPLMLGYQLNAPYSLARQVVFLVALSVVAFFVGRSARSSSPGPEAAVEQAHRADAASAILM